jgi:hypothetical protein
MKNHTLHLLSIVALVNLLSACTKKETTKKTTCASTLYAYSVTDPVIFAPTAPALYGVVDPATVTSSSSVSFANTACSNQGAYNTSDNCYYVFRYRNSGATDTLFKITAAGVVTTYTTTSMEHLEGLVYNQTNNKFYCLRYTSATPADVVEVTTSGSSFSVTTVGTTVHVTGWASPATSTVNNTTGAMYFALEQASTGVYSIEQYLPGASTATVIVTGTDKRIMGLRFNKNDNMLYAIAEDTPTTSTDYFVKIAPSSGSMTVLSTLSFAVNNELYTAALDACTNRYILSTALAPGYTTFTVKQFDMTGAVVQSNTTTGLYQGFIVN